MMKKMDNILEEMDNMDWKMLYSFLNKMVFSKYIYLVAFLWWLFESTFLMMIPDILITFVVLFSMMSWLKVMMLNMLWALLWWSIMYLFWKYNILFTMDFLKSLPFMNEGMLDFASDSLTNSWFMAMVKWPSDWIPYKMYSSFAWSMNLNYLDFLLYSIPASLTSLLLSLILMWFISTLMSKNFEKYYLYFFTMFILIWTFIYWIYFYNMLSLY